MISCPPGVTTARRIVSRRKKVFLTVLFGHFLFRLSSHVRSDAAVLRDIDISSYSIYSVYLLGGCTYRWPRLDRLRSNTVVLLNGAQSHRCDLLTSGVASSDLKIRTQSCENTVGGKRQNRTRAGVGGG